MLNVEGREKVVEKRCPWLYFFFFLFLGEGKRGKVGA